MLTALRRARPRARIGWVVEAAYAPLLNGHPALDDILPVRLKAWRRRPFAAATVGEVRRFLAALDAFSAEIVLDLMGNHKAGLMAALTLADRRLGAARPFRREPSSAFWLSERLAVRGVHVVDRTLSLLAGLGIALPPMSGADFGGAQLFPGVGPPTAVPYALLHPGAGWANKRYPPAHWGEVARRLAASTGLPTWVAVNPGEEDLAAAVVAAAGGSATAVPAAGLAALAGLARGARLVLGGDSGPLHLAHALGAPVLMLHGPTDPATHGPYGAPQRALAVRLPCSFCHRRLAGSKACLLEIPPARVAQRAAELMVG